MTEIEQQCLFLPNCAADKLAKEDFGKLSAVLSGDQEAVRVSILDMFDHALIRSGRFLICDDKGLELTSRSGAVITQAGVWDGGFVADLKDGAVKTALGDLTNLRSILAVGEVEREEVALALIDDEGKTRAKGSIQQLSSSEGGVGLFVTLQGLRGYDKALSLLRDKLCALGAVEIGGANVYAALFPKSAVYQAKPDIEIGLDEAAIDVAVDIMVAYLPVARANETGIVDDLDTEYLHDYRIALRKIRSVLSLFKGVFDEEQTLSLKSRFSALMAPTGRVRDLDVYLLEKQKYYDLVPDSLHGGLDKMFSMFADEREDQHRALVTHLKSKAYRREVSDLIKLLSKPKKLARGPNADFAAHDYASQLIWKRYRKICKIASGIGHDTDDEEVHELRIHCKKLRYLMEFFGPLFPKKEFKGLIKPLKRLQDNLGYFNDYSVQKDALAAYLDTLDIRSKKQHMQVAQSVGALIAILHGRQVEEREKVVDSFAQFNSAETKQTFRALFHAREVPK